MNEENDILNDLKHWLEMNNQSTDNLEEIYANINAGDIITLMTAFDSQDFDTVAQIYNKAKAEASSSFKQMQQESVSAVSVLELERLYRLLPNSSYRTNYLSEAHLRTLVYEGIVSSMNAATSSTGSNTIGDSPDNAPNVSNNMNNTGIQPQGVVGATNNAPQSQQVSQPNTQQQQMSVQQKQNLVKQNPNIQVSVGNGLDSAESIIGTQIDPSNPNNSKVVVKDPNNAGQVQVLDLNDVNLMNDKGE